MKKRTMEDVYPHLEGLIEQYGTLVVGYCSDRTKSSWFGQGARVHIEKTAAECARFVKNNPEYRVA